MTSPILDPEVEARRKERAEEYGQWEAAGVIEIGGARAFNEGDPVPAGTVARLKLDDLGLVAKAGTKAAKTASDAASEAPVVVNGGTPDAKATTRTKGGSR